MRRSHVRSPAGAAGINITPMVDMVFILLIFFALTSSFVKESGMDVDRPAAQSAVRQEDATIMVAVTQSGEVWIDKRKVDARSVRAHIERLHAENPQGAVVIVADRDSRTGMLVQVMDQARLAGVDHVSVATREPARR